MRDIIYELNNGIVIENQRSYLGLSNVGIECGRLLQYYHYFAYEIKVSKRMKRIFEMGKFSEKLVIDNLISEGIQVRSSQKECIGYAGHWKGHIDAEVEYKGIDCIFEFKSAASKYYNQMIKSPMKKANVEYYMQSQAYMGHFEIDYTFEILHNKDNSEIHLELIPFDEHKFASIQEKEKEIVESNVLLDKIGNGNPSWFKCKMCAARDICHFNAPIKQTCRSCSHVDVLPEGKWYCTNHQKDLSFDDQIKSCEEYKLDKMFL